MIADLTVVAGPMFAGKTSALIARIRGAIETEGRAVVVIKPAMDKRYANDAIVTHDRVTWRAVPVSSAQRVIELVAVAAAQAGGPVEVFADEIQFMEAPHFDGSFHLLVHALLQDGHAVTCAGLDLDWRGLPFDVTARLLAMADHVEKLKARCNASGQPASKTFRKSAEGPRIVLGAGDVYEARNNRHWSLEPAERERARRAAGA